MQVICPHCNAHVDVSASDAGAAVSCASCGGNFQAPLPSAGGGTGGASSPEVQSFAGKKIAAGVCGILLGSLGIHKFILGLNGAAGIMLAVTLLGYLGSCFTLGLSAFASAAMGIIGLVEGILYLTKSDQEFYQAYAIEKKQWF